MIISLYNQIKKRDYIIVVTKGGKNTFCIIQNYAAIVMYLNSILLSSRTLVVNLLDAFINFSK